MRLAIARGKDQASKMSIRLRTLESVSVCLGVHIASRPIQGEKNHQGLEEHRGLSGYLGLPRFAVLASRCWVREAVKKVVAHLRGLSRGEAWRPVI